MPTLSFLSWFVAMTVGLAALVRIVVFLVPTSVRGALGFRDPVRSGRTVLAACLAGAALAASAGYLSFALYAVHQCEAHDDCASAPAWVGDGLHELQRMDGGCVYLPQGCTGAGRIPVVGSQDGTP